MSIAHLAGRVTVIVVVPVAAKCSVDKHLQLVVAPAGVVAIETMRAFLFSGVRSDLSCSHRNISSLEHFFQTGLYHWSVRFAQELYVSFVERIR